MITFIRPFSLILTVLFLMSCSSSTWEDARQADTYEAYQSYMEANPDGAHLAQARQFADTLYWQSIQDDTTAASFDRYLQEFPDGAFRSAAESKLQHITSGGFPTQGTVTGSGVIIRADHTTAAASMGVVAKSGTPVQVLEAFGTANNSEAILNTSVTTTVNGRNATLPKGKAVRVIRDLGDSVEVSFASSQYGPAETTIAKADIEAIEGQTWYKVETRDGITGWIFGKFIEL